MMRTSGDVRLDAEQFADAPERALADAEIGGDFFTGQELHKCEAGLQGACQVENSATAENCRAEDILGQSTVHKRHLRGTREG